MADELPTGRAGADAAGSPPPSAASHGPADGAAPPWWAPPALSRVWARIAERLQHEGLVPTGRVGIEGLTRDERHALADLLGRSVVTAHVRIDLAALDARLRARAGVGLVEAARRGTGRELVDRPAVQAREAAAREAPVAAYATWRQHHPDAAWPGLDDWFAGLRRDGVLTRDADPVGLLRDALDILWEQRAHLQPNASSGAARRGAPETNHLPVARTELAARIVGDAHALDDDRRLAAVVLRAVEAVAAATAPRDLPSGGLPSGDLSSGPSERLGDEQAGGADRSRRALWEDLGVLSDQVSSTCLTLGLLPHPGAAGVGAADAGRRLAAYTSAGAVLHLTWRDLRGGLELAAGQTVLVCENPRVVESAAEREVSEVGFVCTSGRPALVTLEVLHRLRAAGCRLLYHGDFDWAGIAMANDLVHRFGVVPWRMSAAEYLRTPARLELRGSRVEAAWDPELAPAMAHRGLAVHEEALLPGLILGLSRLAAQD